MNTLGKVALGIGATALIGIGIALATPIVGVNSPFLATGKYSKETSVHGRGVATSGASFHVSLESEGPATVATQIGSYAAGGHNGWHSHPGLVVVTLVSGSITWYDENCEPTVFNAGDSWIEGDKPHSFKLNGTTGAQLYAWFITAQGKPYRTDLAAPACAASLGL